MKKLIYVFALVAAMMSAACSKVDDAAQQEGKGAVSFSVTRAAGAEDTFELMKFRVYSVAADGEQTLIRLYSYDEIKDMKMWLVAGKYSIAVEGGVKSPASFTDIYYQGHTDFDLAAGEDKTINVKVSPKNTLIKVVFDESVTKKMENAQAVIAIDDAFRVDKIISGEVANLTYKQTAVGFFMIDEEQTSFAWNFSGDVTSKGTSVEKMGVYTPADGFKEGAQYTITFKYSDDLGGYITMDIAVDESVKEFDNMLVFKPEPQITGSALESVIPVYAGMDEITFNVKAISELSSLKIALGDEVYEYSIGGDNGEMDDYIAVSQVNEGSNLEVEVTISDALLTKAAAGEQTMVVTAIDAEGVEGEVDVKLCGEGIASSDINKWMGTASFKVYINNPAASDKKLYCRVNGTGEWTEVALGESADGNLYNVVSEFSGGGNSYEYYVGYGGEQKSEIVSFSTQNIQIPNAGMEEWQGDSPLLPYTSTQWWDTGNHGAATLGKNVTTSSTDVRPGSTGQYSAYLKSQFVGLGSIGKFAAGNIFFGKYLETNGTNGVIGFGQPFTFECKPKKLVVWYKGQVGTCDYKGGSVAKGDSDKSTIYVWLCNWSGQHKVNTADSSTFVNPETTATTAEGNVLGYGVWSRVISSSDSGADNGWTKLEIPITYREGEGFTGVKPNYLVISCAASAYGDYFAGSTDSYMYVDDFEFVY